MRNLLDRLQAAEQQPQEVRLQGKNIEILPQQELDRNFICSDFCQEQNL